MTIPCYLVLHRFPDISGDCMTTIMEGLKADTAKWRIRMKELYLTDEAFTFLEKYLKESSLILE